MLYEESPRGFILHKEVLKECQQAEIPPSPWAEEELLPTEDRRDQIGRDPSLSEGIEHRWPEVILDDDD